MKGGKLGRRESAISRRLKNLKKYAAPETKDVDRAKKAFRDISFTCLKLKKEVPPEARGCLNQLGLKDEDVFTAKVAKATEAAELPEEVLGVSQE